MTSKHIEEIRPIIYEASDAIMSVYNQLDMEVQYKSDHTPVTTADIRSNTILIDGLKERYPDIPAISEESTVKPYDERKQIRQYWLIDPLDGTKGFIRRTGDFCINLALIEDNIPVLGIIYIPISDRLFWAIKGCGAYEYVNGESRTIECNKISLQNQGLKIASSSTSLNKRVMRFMDNLEHPKLIQIGSAIKLAMIACGEADIYMRFGNTMEWDIAAGQVILQEAGGQVLKLDKEAALEYNKEDLLNPEFIAIGKMDDTNSIYRVLKLL